MSISMFFLVIGTTFAQLSHNSCVKSVKVTYTQIKGLDPEDGIKRGDPSDIIKVKSLYYVWYWKVGLNVRWGVWYATSPDGYTWTERGEAVGPGEKGSWDDHGCFTPGILVANNKYYLFYLKVHGLNFLIIQS